MVLKRNSAEALGNIGDIRAVEPLIKKLNEGFDNNIRAISAEALGKIGDKRSVESLIAKINN